MASHTTLLVAIGIALLLIAALFGMASTTIGLGGDAVDNFSDRADSDDDGPSFSSYEADPEEETEDVKPVKRNKEVKI